MKLAKDFEINKTTFEIKILLYLKTPSTQLILYAGELAERLLK